MADLLKPIYSRLGSRELLEKCIDGYTQNANESLHSTVWKLCPKELFLGRESVDIACSIAVCRFNDGAFALLSLAKKLELTSSRFCKQTLRRKDKLRIQKAKYKSSERGRTLWKKARKKRKGLEDKNKEKEGPMYMYVAGGFDCEPGPSTCKRTRMS